MFQYAYYCKQIYFQQEQSKLSGEIAFFSNLKKRGFQSGLKFESWATSGGSSDKDWYKIPNTAAIYNR